MINEGGGGYGVDCHWGLLLLGNFGDHASLIDYSRTTATDDHDDDDDSKDSGTMTGRRRRSGGGAYPMIFPSCMHASSSI
jgi:hypothetical protein